MATPAQLFRLEQLDADLDHRRAALAEARRRLQRDPEGEAAGARLERVRAEEREAVTRQRRLEGDLADIEGRLKRDQDRLYGGSIIDPRELASLEKEMQGYREWRDSTENDLLAAMERTEALQEEVVSLTRQVEDRRAQRESGRPDLMRQAEELAAAVAECEAERNVLAGELEPPALAHYTRLRQRAGHAVSHVSGGVCQWCRVAIPPKDVQHARGGAIVSCTNCGRILYVG